MLHSFFLGRACGCVQGKMHMIDFFRPKMTGLIGSAIWNLGRDGARLLDYGTHRLAAGGALLGTSRHDVVLLSARTSR